MPSHFVLLLCHPSPTTTYLSFHLSFTSESDPFISFVHRYTTASILLIATTSSSPDCARRPQPSFSPHHPNKTVKMVYSLSYTRPPFMGNSRGSNSGSRASLNGDEKQNSINESIKTASSCSMCAGIPEPLSFDRIIKGGTCPVSHAYLPANSMSQGTT